MAGYLCLIQCGGKQQTPCGFFLVDVPSSEEEHRLRWESIPQISPTPVLCSVNLKECLSER